MFDADDIRVDAGRYGGQYAIAPLDVFICFYVPNMQTVLVHFETRTSLLRV